jgi:hypothetical protein
MSRRIARNLRILGNVGFIAGQFSLLFVSKDLGLCIMVVCGLLSLPYFLKHRYYDIVVLSLIGLAINLVGLLT